jgi:peptidoglycan hydrolase-like protein with peptidoglycan-binding domain
MATKKKAESKDATMVTLPGNASFAGNKPTTAAPPFPLDEGHYFSLPVTSRNSHSGMRGLDAAHVRAIQRALHMPETGRYTFATATAVGQWQRSQHRPVTRVVDKDTWEALLQK